MKKGFNLFFIAILGGIKHTLYSFINSVNNYRFFYGVRFHNSQNIMIDPSSNIESGSMLIVNKPENENHIYIKIGKECWIGRNAEFQSYFKSKISISDYVSVQDRCKILGEVMIGQYTLLAPEVFISSGNHIYEHTPEYLIKEQDRILKSTPETFISYSHPITIEEDCWIGKGAMIKQGVYIGRGAVVGAGALVTKNVSPYTVVGGTPSRVIKERYRFDPPSFIASNIREHLPYFYRGFYHLYPAKLLDDNSKGILSKSVSLVTLKKISWREIHIKGWSFSNSRLAIFVDGVFLGSEDLDEGEFSRVFIFSESFEGVDLDDSYAGLPDFMKQHLLLTFKLNEVDSDFGFAIKSIELL
jgi:acetyltransferase-like isoleucine patch superfamily enzyme